MTDKLPPRDLVAHPLDDRPSPEYVVMRLKGIERAIDYEYKCVAYAADAKTHAYSSTLKRYWTRSIKEHSGRIDALEAERARLTNRD
jgi:hypothetical protein